MAGVSELITDAVTQTNVKVLAEAPAMGLGTLYQAMAHSASILFENGTNYQQQQNLSGQAATNIGLINVYSLGTLAGAAATEKMATLGTPDAMSGNLALVNLFKTLARE